MLYKQKEEQQVMELIEWILKDENLKSAITTAAYDGETITNTVETGTSTDEETADTPSTFGPPSEPTQLPQTGQLWWPVPILGLGGIILIAIGAYWKRKKKEV